MVRAPLPLVGRHPGTGGGRAARRGPPVRGRPRHRRQRARRAQPRRPLQHDADHRHRGRTAGRAPQIGADVGGEADLDRRRRQLPAGAPDPDRPARRPGLRREHQHAGPLHAAGAGRTRPRLQLHRPAGGSRGLRHGGRHRGPHRRALLRGQGLLRRCLLHDLPGDRGHHRRRRPGGAPDARPPAQRAVRDLRPRRPPGHRTADRRRGHRLRRDRPRQVHPAQADARHHRPLQPLRRLPAPRRQPPTPTGDLRDRPRTGGSVPDVKDSTELKDLKEEI